jgi:hypothetical protein
MERSFTEGRKEAKTRLARAAPFLPCVSCDISVVLDQVRRDRVPGPTGQIRVLFIAQQPLACILQDQATAEILLHPLLNTPDTPPAVFLHLLTHEMLHLVIPARAVDGKNTIHPPEFLAREAAVAPERQESYAWIWFNFGGFLKEGRKGEGVTVKRGWQEIMHAARVPLERCNEIRTGLTL